MHPRILKLVLFAAGFGLLVFAVQRQRDATTTLREKADRLRAASLAHARLRNENAVLTAQKISGEELTKLRADQAEAARLRAEAASLQEKREPVRRSPTAEGVSAPTSPITLTQWTNAGRATPTATFQTGVWAAVQGDTDALTKVITFDADGRALIEAQFGSLPEKDRALYGSPEKIFATLLAVRLPQDLTSATVTQTTEGSGSTLLRMRLQHANGYFKDSSFNFIRSAEDNSWRILVPTGVVKNHLLMLTEPAVVHIQ